MKALYLNSKYLFLLMAILMNATRLSIKVSVLPLPIVVTSHIHCSFLRIKRLKKKYPKLGSIKSSCEYYICEILGSIRVKGMCGHHRLIKCGCAY